MYKENPKTKGSGIFAAVPQKGNCPLSCPECFFNSGRSYLEPLEENLPNIPPLSLAETGVVRVNDCGDSMVDPDLVERETKHFPRKFYNSSNPDVITRFFPDPVVLTINPGDMTDKCFMRLESVNANNHLDNLMFVRFRANMWNAAIAVEAASMCESLGIPIVMTFMAYHNIDSIPSDFQHMYSYHKRTMNNYYAITPEAWEIFMRNFSRSHLVYTCGNEGYMNRTHCSSCGNCLREYFATVQRCLPYKNS